MVGDESPLFSAALVLRAIRLINQFDVVVIFLGVFAQFMDD